MEHYGEMKVLRSMGIEPGCRFELKELTGSFMIDTENQVVCDRSQGYNCVVNGLYENLLKGKYHVKR